MTTSLHYRLRKLSGTIEELGERRDNGPADALDSVHHSVIRVRESGGVVALENVVVPVQVEACLAPGVRCDLYLVEAQAQICSPAYRKCAVDGAFSHVFAVVCGDQCVTRSGRPCATSGNSSSSAWTRCCPGPACRCWSPSS